MERATELENDFLDENRPTNCPVYGQTRWKKRRTFGRKNRKPARPSTYMGQRTNRRYKVM